MPTALTTVLVLTLSLVTAQERSMSDDDAAIRRVIQQQDEARERGDWKALGQLFTEDADWLTSTGEWRKGRAQIEKSVAQAGRTTYKGGSYATTVESVRLMTPTVAMVDTVFEIANIDGGSRKGHRAYVLVKSGKTWLIAANRSMVPAPAGATSSR